MADDPNDMQGLAKALKQEPAPLTPQETYQLLPKLGRELIDVMGFDAAMLLIEKRGGQRIQIQSWPLKRDSRKFDDLVAVVGQDPAEKFADRWAGIEIQVPTDARLCRAQRVRAAVAAYSAGIGVPDLARQHRVTESTIWKWLKKPI